jgi:polyribonucleotide nucleotidyltransferase
MWRESMTIGRRRIALETGRIARQAESAVVVRDGGTVLLVAVGAAREGRPGLDFLPLTVEYREKFSAAGRYPGGYRKREGRISDHEILSSRLIDRTIRPLFPKGFTVETQVLATVLSYDPDSDPEVLAISGAAAALHRSGLVWAGPVAGVRVARVDGTLVAMPTAAERERASLDLVVSAGPSGLVMVEGRAAEASEAEVVEALLFAQEAVRPACELIEAMRAATGEEKRQFSPGAPPPELVAQVSVLASEPLREAVRVAEKRERRARIAAVRESVRAALASAGAPPADVDQAGDILDRLLHDLVRDRVLAEGRRLDGRGLADIRPISGEVGWLPAVHGSSLFTRGETQALVVCTLGTGQDEQAVEDLAGEHSERFLLHYSFPPYSVGEVRPLRGPGRREIGHGNLAHRALGAVLPPPEAFPYTIRIESEISESNGSSSMATVCGGSLALMDAGVPVERPVAGVAMGLILDGERAAILSDILGDEDHLGDMDFKVAGTERGITAVQMDNKLGSLARAVLEQALEQARRGRLHVLGEMAKILAAPRPDLAPHAPRIAVEKIRPNRIRDLIGPGGRVIQELQAETGTKIDVEDDGTVRIASPGGAGLEAALRQIRELCGEPEVGKVYRGTVTGVKEFGCFVRVMGSIEGLVHVSDLGGAGEIGEGDPMEVRVLGVDDRGRIKLARARG